MSRTDEAYINSKLDESFARIERLTKGEKERQLNALYNIAKRGRKRIQDINAEGMSPVDFARSVIMAIDYAVGNKLNGTLTRERETISRLLKEAEQADHQ
ncbi:hypothetical protein JXD20_03075 [Candidatus Peregrinibacteria bacterium]|nr:hypothetical protein [Candidatus Peregrinibacteria bacterium]